MLYKPRLKCTTSPSQSLQGMPKVYFLTSQQSKAMSSASVKSCLPNVIMLHAITCVQTHRILSSMPFKRQSWLSMLSCKDDSTPLGQPLLRDIMTQTLTHIPPSAFMAQLCREHTVQRKPANECNMEKRPCEDAVHSSLCSTCTTPSAGTPVALAAQLFPVLQYVDEPGIASVRLSFNQPKSSRSAACSAMWLRHSRAAGLPAVPSRARQTLLQLCYVV